MFRLAPTVRIAQLPCSGEIPVGQENSLFTAEQGIACNALELLHELMPSNAKRAVQGENFRKFPVIFPVLSCRPAVPTSLDETQLHIW